MKLPNRNQKGQALLLVLLTMAAILTVVLSVASRSITEVAVTSYEEDALRAFSAAEAGVEQALLNPVIGPIPSRVPDPSDPSVFYVGSVNAPPDADAKSLYTDRLKSGETATFWLVSHDANGELSCVTGQACYGGNNIEVCWADPAYLTYGGDSSKRPAIEALLFYDTTRLSAKTDTNPTNNYQNLQVARIANKDPLNTYAVGFLNPNPPGPCNPIDGQNFARRSSIPLPAGCSNNRACPIMVKVRMYFSDFNFKQPVGIRVTGGGPASRLPAQGLQISSEGTAGESTRRVSVFQGYSEPPSLFDAAVFSLRDLIHN